MPSDVAGVSFGNAAVARERSPEFAPGQYFGLPEATGPFPPNGLAPGNSVDLAAVADTSPFDPAVSADSGDFWAISVDPNATYSPLNLAPGESGTITIKTQRDGDGVLVQIGDDGPGIPPEVREHVFDAFFTTKEVGKGTGVGLELARRIVVDRHDGSISVDSEPGRTTFSVRLQFKQH